jgi:hypothetical protein
MAKTWRALSAGSDHSLCSALHRLEPNASVQNLMRPSLFRRAIAEFVRVTLMLQRDLLGVWYVRQLVPCFCPGRSDFPVDGAEDGQELFEERVARADEGEVRGQGAAEQGEIP